MVPSFSVPLRSTCSLAALRAPVAAPDLCAGAPAVITNLGARGGRGEISGAGRSSATGVENDITID
jgi:hypothetical protein